MSNILDTFAEITGATRKAILEKVGVAELQKNESVFRTLILDELEREAKKKFTYNESRPVIKIRAALTVSESQILEKNFPEFTLDFVPSTRHSHGLAYSSRLLETELLMRMLSKEKFRNSSNDFAIIDVGGNYYYHFKRDNPIHSCCPVLDAYDNLRNSKREYMIKTYLSKHASNEIKRRKNFIYSSHVCNAAAEICDKTADSLLFIHSIYDIGLKGLGKIMFQKKSSYAVGSYLFNANIFLMKKGKIGYGATFEIVNDATPVVVGGVTMGHINKKKILFSFIDDSSLNYLHDYEDYVEFVKSTHVIYQDDIYFIEHNERSDGLCLFTVTKGKYDTPTSSLRFKRYADVGSYKVLSIYDWDVTICGKSPVMHMKKNFLKISEELFNNIYNYGLTRTEGQFTVQSLVNAATSFNSRIIINGQNVIENAEKLDPMNLLEVCTIIYIHIYELRYEQGLVLKTLQNELEMVRDSAKGGFWNNLVKYLFTTTPARFENFECSYLKKFYLYVTYKTRFPISIEKYVEVFDCVDFIEKKLSLEATEDMTLYLSDNRESEGVVSLLEEEVEELVPDYGILRHTESCKEPSKKFFRMRVPKDGNCMFNALILVLDLKISLNAFKVNLLSKIPANFTKKQRREVIAILTAKNDCGMIDILILASIYYNVTICVHNEQVCTHVGDEPNVVHLIYEDCHYDALLLDMHIPDPYIVDVSQIADPLYPHEFDDLLVKVQDTIRDNPTLAKDAEMRSTIFSYDVNGYSNRAPNYLSEMVYCFKIDTTNVLDINCESGNILKYLRTHANSRSIYHYGSGRDKYKSSIVRLTASTGMPSHCKTLQSLYDIMTVVKNITLVFSYVVHNEDNLLEMLHLSRFILAPNGTMILRMKYTDINDKVLGYMYYYFKTLRCFRPYSMPSLDEHFIFILSEKTQPNSLEDYLCDYYNGVVDYSLVSSIGVECWMRDVMMEHFDRYMYVFMYPTQTFSFPDGAYDKATMYPPAKTLGGGYLDVAKTLVHNLCSRFIRRRDFIPDIIYLYNKLMEYVCSSIVIDMYIFRGKTAKELRSNMSALDRSSTTILKSDLDQQDRVVRSQIDVEVPETCKSQNESSTTCEAENDKDIPPTTNIVVKSGMSKLISSLPVVRLLMKGEACYSPKTLPDDVCGNRIRNSMYEIAEYWRVTKFLLYESHLKCYTTMRNLPPSVIKRTIHRFPGMVFIINDIVIGNTDSMNYDYIFTGKIFEPFKNNNSQIGVLSERIRIFLEPRLYDAVSSYLQNIKTFELPAVEFVEGVPGCGKTHTIISSHKPNEDLVLVSTKEGRRDIIDRVRSVLGVEPDKDNYRTLYSYIINSRRKYTTVWVDEAMMHHPGAVFFTAYMTECKYMKLLGDFKQIPYINRDPLIPLRFTRLQDMVKCTSYLTISRRCPIDVIEHFSKDYMSLGMTKPTTTNTIKHSVEFKVVKNLSVIPRGDVTYLTFKQSEKLEMQKARFNNVYTVHEFQGKQADIIYLVRLSVKPAETIYNSPEHVLVALTRHKKLLTYYTRSITRDMVVKTITSMRRSIRMEGGGVCLETQNALLKKCIYYGNVTGKLKTINFNTKLTHDSSSSVIDFTKSISKFRELNDSFQTLVFDKENLIKCGFDINNFIKLYKGNIGSRLAITTSDGGRVVDNIRINNYMNYNGFVDKVNTVITVDEFAQTNEPLTIRQSSNSRFDDVTLLQNAYDSVFPGHSYVDQSFDRDIIEINDIDIPVENSVFSTSKKPSRTTQWNYMVPVLKTSMPYPRVDSQIETLLALVKRNMNVPVYTNTIGEEFIAQALFENFKDSYLIRNSLFFDEINISVDLVQNWLTKQPPSALAELDTIDNMLYMHVLDEYKLIIKKSPKPKLDNTAITEYTGLQTVCYQGPITNILFCPIFKEMKKRLLCFLKSKYMIFTDMTTTALERLITQLNPSDYYPVEVDISKYDKSQGKMLFEFELLLYRFLGMSEFCLRLWRLMHERTVINDKKNKIKARIEYQRKSGDAATFFGNTVVLMAILASVYDMDSCKMGLFAGDDSLLLFESPQPDINQLLLDGFNLESKIYHFDFMYFCSKFILHTEFGWYIIPDPIKLLTKLGRHDIRNETHREEYRIAVADTTEDYNNIILLPYIERAISERYGHQVGVLMLDTLYRVPRDKKVFNSLFLIPEGPMFPETLKIFDP
jgi:hypothetical protein